MNKKKTHKLSRSSYFFVLGNEQIRIKPEVFAKYSRRFAQELPSNPKEMHFTQNVARETFIAFVSACQERSISIDKHLIYELIDVARSWGVDVLEEYCSNFCAENRI